MSLPTVAALLKRENYLGSILWHGNVFHVVDHRSRLRVYQVRRGGVDLVASWWLSLSEISGGTFDGAIHELFNVHEDVRVQEMLHV